MDFSVQYKIRGDGYSGGFVNGLSMVQSDSMRKCTLLEADEARHIFVSEDKFRITAEHNQIGDVYECRSTFENRTDETVVLEMLSSFCVENISADVLHRALSFWSAEGKLLSQKLTSLNLEPSWSGHGMRIEKFGQIGSMPVRKWFPFAVLEDSVNGTFVGVQIYCASSWQMELFRNREPVALAGGLADYDYGHWYKEVLPGEIFESPKAVVAVGKSLYEVCDKLIKAQKPDIASCDEELPVIFNEYCTSWGNPTIECLEKTAKKLQNTGIKYLVMDCGWYKEEGKNWWDVIGDWNPCRELFPNGLKEVGDMIRSYGLIPGIWYEMEKCASMAKVYEETDHLLTRHGHTLTVGGHHFLDMRDKWCVDYLDQKVIKQIKDSGFGYLKVDYNDNIGVGCDGAESLGEGLRQAVLASQDYFRRIKQEIPELVIENCSSGGHRLEPSMMELVSQASFSDAHECVSIPLIAANMHRLIQVRQSQIWAVLHAADDIHRTNYSLTAGFLGRLCLSGEIFDLPEENWNQALKAVTFYGKIAPIIKNGYTSVIYSTAEDYNHPTGYQAVLREWKDEALLVVHTFENGENPDLQEYLKGWEAEETFGSELNGAFRGKAFWLRRK